MKTKFTQKHFLIITLISVTALNTIAAPTLDLYIENDSRFIKPNGNTDRHYTSGVKFTFTTCDYPKWAWPQWLGGWAFKDDPPQNRALGLFIGQNIYTPDFADNPAQRHTNDMTFAGWLNAGLYMQRTNNTKLEHTELNFGIIGPSSKSEQAQDLIHETVDSPEPVWDSQIDDEFAFDFKYMIRQKTPIPYLQDLNNIDLAIDYGFTVGSVHRHAEIATVLRYGWNLENDFGPGSLDLPVSALHSNSNTLYSYLRLAARAVEHNRFLTGLDEEPLTGSLQAGLVWKFKSFSIGYSQTYFTQNFEEQNGNDSIGALTLSFKF
jgi:hypothetical protein